MDETDNLLPLVFIKVKNILNLICNSWDSYVNTKMSREQANHLKNQAALKSGNKIVDRKLKKRIKDYCHQTFGSTAFWPWIAAYCELRGGFKEGWIPEDYYRFTLLPRMNPEKFMRFSEAKTLDHKLFKDLLIGPLFFRSNGQYCGGSGQVKKWSDIKRRLRNLDKEIVIKPDSGRGGKHIVFKHSNEVDLDFLPTSTDLLIQEVLQQHSELNRLYSQSINTFRVLTYIDTEGTVKIKFIIVRFGRGGARIDNATGGGGWIFVHLNGKIEPVAYNSNGISIGTRHPDTGTEYAGLELPFLPKIIKLCKKAHYSFPYTRIIGWDVFVDRQGKPKLIEWNANNPFFGPIEARFGPFFEEVTLQ